MKIIPNQLHGQRFIKTKEKIPFEKDWSVTNNYSLDHSSFQEYIKDAKTYGVLCGYNNLLVVDVDNEEIQKQLLDKHPIFNQTFTVKSAGKGLYHFYFYTDIVPESKKCLDINLNTLLDIQGRGKQVIGPDSELSNGKKYEVIKDVPIYKIGYNSLMEILLPYGVRDKDVKVEFNNKEPIIEEIKRRYKVPDLLKEIGINKSKNPTECPFHESKGGKCLSFTDELWHCFHCNKSGDVLTLYKEYYKTDFAETKQKLMLLSGLSKLEKKQQKPKDNILKEYKEIAIIRYVRYKSKDETIYKIYISDFYISLTPDEVLLANPFRKKFFNETGTLLKPLDNFSWAELTNQWVAEHGEIIDQSMETQDNHMVESIVNEISGFAVVFTGKEAMSYGRLYYNKETDSIHISCKVLDLIIKKNNYKITLSKVKYLLDDYVIGKSVVVRTGKTTNRFFCLNNEKMKIEFEKEKYDNEENI